MIVFVEGQPKKSDYRKFKIACAANGQDDYASMREMLTRRVQRYVDGDEKFAPLPNAFMIDGGLGHVHVCKEVLDSFGLSVPCFGMVKDDRHRTRALVAPDGREFGISATPALFALIGRMQEEVHRFAIEYNRKLGGKKVALFGSYGWGDGQWMRDWAERTTKTGANLYDDGLMVNGFPDADAKVQCTAFGEGFGAY